MSSDKKRRIYSRRGDLGETSLLFGPRVGKDQIRIVLVGHLDELNAMLGLIRTEPVPQDLSELLLEIQKLLFGLGAEVVSLSPPKQAVKMINQDDIHYLEEKIDYYDQYLPALSQFIIPGGCRSSALLHVARTITRRAERHAVLLLRRDPEVSRYIIGWLNRLGDLFFVLARWENQNNSRKEESI